MDDGCLLLDIAVWVTLGSFIVSLVGYVWNTSDYDAHRKW